MRSRPPPSSSPRTRREKRRQAGLQPHLDVHPRSLVRVPGSGCWRNSGRSGRSSPASAIGCRMARTGRGGRAAAARSGRAEERRNRLAHPWWRPNASGVVDRRPVHGRLVAASHSGSFPPYAERGRTRTVGASPTSWARSSSRRRATCSSCRRSTRRARRATARPTGRGCSPGSRIASTGGRRSCSRSGPCCSTAARSTRWMLARSPPSRNGWCGRPDMFGSIAFMIASTLAWLEVCHGWWRGTPRHVVADRGAQPPAVRSRSRSRRSPRSSGRRPASS